MENSMLSSPVKPRPNFSNNPSTSGAAFIRRPQPPLYIPTGQVAFRLLCHSSRIGGLIGKSGCIIKQLQQLTNCHIRVEDPTNAVTEHRVISVIGSPLLKRRIKLVAEFELEEKDSDAGDWFEMSAAQEGMLRVFERVVEVAAEGDSEAAIGGVVSCRLLAWKSQVGAVIGKGGAVVDKIRKDAGCKIKVLVSGKLLSGAFPTEEVVEIEGDILAVKKALVAVTGRLQEFPSNVVPGSKPVEQEPLPKKPLVAVTGSRQEFPSNVMPGSKPVGLEPLPLNPVDLSQQHNMMLHHMPSNSIYNALGDSPLSDHENVNKPETKTQQQEMVLRLLCPNERVGRIIGKGGSIVQSIQNESGAHITIGPIVPDCSERLITVTAKENAENQFSPLQNAAVLVFNRYMEVTPMKGSDSGTKGSTTLARVVIPSNQVGCLLGKGGSVISDMRKATGTSLRIFGGLQVPKCASENVEVLQILGDVMNVQDALRKVTNKLSEFIFSQQMLNINGSRKSLKTDNSNYNRVRGPRPTGLHQSHGVPYNSINDLTSSTRSMDYLGISNIDRPASSNLVESTTDRSLPSRKAGVELGSGTRSAIITNTTVEIIVPSDLIGAIYGENSSNLDRLRQISGAKVIVHEPQPGTTDRMVIISGSPDETQAAQSLLQAFLLAGG